MGREVSSTDVDGTTFSWTWNLHGSPDLRRCRAGTGADPPTVTDTHGTTTYTYHPAGRLAEAATPQGSIGYS